MGGSAHPILGYLGVMSAKNTAVNILILTTFMSFLLYRRTGRIAQPEHDGDELPPVHRHSERPGPHRRLGRVGKGLADDAGYQRPVRLPVQALRVPGEQAAEGERGRGPLDQHGVRAAGRSVADQDDPAPVLAPRADRREEPSRRLVVRRPAPRRDQRPAAPGEPGQQPRRIGAARLAGQHAVRQVGQDHRPPGQGRGLADDLIQRCAGHGQFGKHLVQPLGGAKLPELGVDDPGVHRLGDLHERNLAREGDQCQPAVCRRPDQHARQRPDVPAAELHRQRAHPRAARRSQVGGVASQQRGFGGQRDPGGEHQLPALQQVRRVGQFEHVDPADLRGHAVGTRDHLRAAAPDHVEGQQVGDGGEHKTKRKARNQDAYIVSVHTGPRDRED